MLNLIFRKKDQYLLYISSDNSLVLVSSAFFLLAIVDLTLLKLN